MKRDAALSDRYELQRKIGAGGMAEVFLGRDRVLGRTVAVKTLLEAHATDPHFIERFRREAQSAAALNHPNVVSVYDTGSDDGTHYIVMEFVEGKTLRDVVREEGPLLPERVAEIGSDVCAGLAFAHAHGIIHRDVKPANIMITPSGGVKVTDFGIARAVSGDTVTQTAMVLGTAQYFSPEQAQSTPVDARSDIYSLGVVLYEMLTRQAPFTGSSPVAIAYKHVKETPIAPSKLNADVPPALEAIVMKALAKNPANRYQSAQDMREDLLRALHGRPVEATPVLSDQTGVISPLADETVMIERTGAARVHREPTPEQKRRKTGLILLAFIAAAILGVAAWALTGLLGGTTQLTVPDVLGEKVTDARKTLEARGFEVGLLAPVPSDEFEPNEVALQDPPAGAKLEEGGTVTLTPSSGTALVKVPKLVGKTETAARSAIEDADLVVGEVGHPTHETIARGRVISQRQAEGSFLPKGAKVDFEVSSGPPTTTVPGVIGDLESDARNRIDNEGLEVQVIPEQPSPECDQPEGRVCRQEPEEGTEVQRGSSVTIYVAEETEPSETPSESPSETPSESPSP